MESLLAVQGYSRSYDLATATGRLRDTEEVNAVCYHDTGTLSQSQHSALTADLIWVPSHFLLKELLSKGDSDGHDIETECFGIVVDMCYWWK